MSRQVIAERDAGIRVKAGTEWPRVDQVVRDERPGQEPSWIVVRGLCNGVPDSSQDYSTEADALDAFGPQE